jgi:hypothetical protein
MFAAAPPAAKKAWAISQASPPIAAITSEVLDASQMPFRQRGNRAPIWPPNTDTNPMAWIMPAAVPRACARPAAKKKAAVSIATIYDGGTKI